MAPLSNAVAANESPIPSNFDVAILGGGILGSATAYFLLQELPTLSLCVIEPDPTYEFASTLRASGGCRVQFTCPENIAMSLYSIGFIKAFEQAMASNGRPAPVDWVEGGYLFIVSPDNVANLERIQPREDTGPESLERTPLDPRFRGDDDNRR
jgi:FAD-dependent oxidoreductase domain-containing protein 1